MTWTYEDTQGLQTLIVCFVIYCLKDTSPFFEMVWNILKLTLVIIFVITTAGLALRWLKKLF